VFAFVLGQCDEAVKNKLQSDSACEMVDEAFDVVALLKMMKDAVCDAHGKKSPALQAVAAWRQLLKGIPERERVVARSLRATPEFD